jgi:hypothetical protein
VKQAALRASADGRGSSAAQMPPHGCCSSVFCYSRFPVPSSASLCARTARRRPYTRTYDVRTGAAFIECRQWRFPAAANAAARPDVRTSLEEVGRLDASQ